VGVGNSGEDEVGEHDFEPVPGFMAACRTYDTVLLLPLLLLLSSGPEAYASDARHPAGLLCYLEPPMVWTFPLLPPGLTTSTRRERP